MYTQYALYTCSVSMYMLERCRRKEEVSKVKQTTKQSNTAHPRQSLFQRKLAASGGIRTHMYMYI